MTPPQQHFSERYGGNAAENYERFFVPAIGAPLAVDLLALVALRPGERVLDVACGTGAVTRVAAQQVGDTGIVAGLDINPAMLAVARAIAPASPSIQWHQASAEAMPLPEKAFDVVLCQMGLQFVPDKIAALREMRRVLVPGGRLAISVPGPTPPLFAIMDEALARHIGPEAAGFVRAVFSLNDLAEIESLVKRAGFDDVTVRRATRKMRLPPPRDFLWQYISSTPLAALISASDDERRAALEREVVANWQPFLENDGLLAEQSITVATARN